MVLISDDLLLNRQVKSYGFLANGAVSVDDVDDADMFKQTEVSIFVEKKTKQTFELLIYVAIS